MRLSIVLEQNGFDNVFPMEVGDDMSLEDFFVLALSEAQIKTDLPSYSLIVNGKVWSYKASVDHKLNLKGAGFSQDDMVIISKSLPATAKKEESEVELSDDKLNNLIRSIKISKRKRENEAERQFLAQTHEIFKKMKIPDFCNKIEHLHPELFKVYKEKPEDLGAFIIVFRHIAEKLDKRRRLMDDPTSAEGQRLLQQEILEKNLNENIDRALEVLPEAFVSIDMLYIRIMLNDHPIIAFIDTGAQVSILSKRAAERCNLMRLVDHRYAITARGIGGMTKALGRIMQCDMLVGDHTFPVSMNVLPNRSSCHDLILGLDIMLRHRAVIELGQRTITFGGPDGSTTSFLNDAEVQVLKEQLEADEAIDDAESDNKEENDNASANQ